MILTRQEQEILHGKNGESASEALKYQMKIGEYYNAKEFIPVSQAHMTADIEVMGESGLQYLEEQNDLNAKFMVPTSTNARCIDVESTLNFLEQSTEAKKKEMRIIEAINQMGAMPIDTCINYQVYYQPHFREHVAWGDTGTVIYANSVFGARTNFESGPAAFAAALTGRVPAYGFHLDENRHATVLIDVETPYIEDIADWGILGRIIGSKVFDYSKVPAINNIERFNPTSDDLKHLGASMATWSVAMFHAIGVTPEAKTIEDATGGNNKLEKITITQNDMIEEYNSFKFQDKHASVVVLSGPQLSLNEVRTVANLLDGKKINSSTSFIITVARSTYKQAQQAGYANIIREAGGKFLMGVCFYLLDGLSEIRKLNNWNTLVTNSVKLANNVKAHRFVPVVRKTVDCINIAIKGEVE